MGNTPISNFRLPEKTKDKLKKLSKQSGTDMTDYLKRLIEYAHKNKLKV